jgi:hypothetical protein
VAAKAMALLESDAELMELANKDSNYQGTHECLPADKLLQICGQRFYTFHPFILERLVCFFAQFEGLRVKMLMPDDIALHRGVFEKGKKGRLL